MYTRNLFDHLFSRWAQLVKSRKSIDDINTYLLKAPSGPYEKILDWIIASQRYNFKLLIRNYSNHKNHLFDQFLRDLTGLDALPTMSYPQGRVNRSPTTAETNFHRVLNSFSLTGPSLAELLASSLPSINAGKTKCSRKTYEHIAQANTQFIDLVNKHLDKQERIIIEPAEDVTNTNSEEADTSLTKKQAKIITGYLSTTMRPIEDKELELISNIAIRISQGSAGLNDAINLMEFAARVEPSNKDLKQYIKKWKQS